MQAAFTLERERSQSRTIEETIVIFLRNRRCPWRCLYCDLWKEALDYTVPRGDIPAQIDNALQLLPAIASPFQLKLYNAGSFFDRAAIPVPDYPAIADRVRRFARVIVESHPALVGELALRFRDLVDPAQLEVAMGLEIADDAILKRLNKRMTLAAFAQAAAFLAHHHIALRAFVIIQPPFIAEHEAVSAAQRSAAFAFDCGATVVSLIPARFGAVALDELSARGDFAPPALATVESAFASCLALNRGRVFLDLWDLPPPHTPSQSMDSAKECAMCRPARLQRLAQANLCQHLSPPVTCTHLKRGSEAC